jgi:hypothetical protein
LEFLLEKLVVFGSLKLQAAEIFPKKKMHGHSTMLVKVKSVDFSVMKTPDTGGNRVDSWPKMRRKIVYFLIITILDIIRYLPFYLKHSIWENEFCLQLQVELTQLGPINRNILILRQRLALIYWPN